MRILAKDTKTVYIIPFSDTVEVTKEVNGKTIRTGEYTQGYGNPFWVKAYVSSPRGLATVDINGINVPEQRTMVINNDRTYVQENPIKEADLVLIPIQTLSQSADEVTTLLLDDGKLSAFAKEDFCVYRIANISPYDYHIQYTLTRIDV